MIRTNIFANGAELQAIQVMKKAAAMVKKSKSLKVVMSISVDGLIKKTSDTRIAIHLLALKHGLPEIKDTKYGMNNAGEFLVDTCAWNE